MKFTIKGELTDLNTYIDAERTNKYIAAKIKKQNTEIVRLFLYGTKYKITKKVKVKITWYCKNMRKDPDGISFAKKFILDGMQEAGIIENDGWKQIAGFEDVFEVDKTNARIEIELLEVV